MPSQNTRKNMFVTEELAQDETDLTYEIFTLEDQSNESTRMQVLLNDVPVDMVLDTGASLSIISQMTFNQLKPRTVACLLREKVEKQLSMMEQQSFSPSWTCPMLTFNLPLSDESK